MLRIDDNAQPYIIINGNLSDSRNMKSDAYFELPFNDTCIYEVIRYIDGIGLFTADHFKRLKDSAIMMDVPIRLTLNEYNEYTSVLLSVNAKENCNIKIICCGNDFVIYMSKFFYPDDSYYGTGADTAVLAIERPKPNAKVRRSDYIDRVDLFKKDKNIFEALIMNNDRLITEGSRSNLFYILKTEPDTVYTSPASLVLEGVMRKYVIRLCSELNIPIKYDALSYSSINNVEAAFLTGTSIKILPIAKIDSTVYTSSHNSVIVRLMRGFNNYIENRKERNK